MWICWQRTVGGATNDHRYIDRHQSKSTLFSGERFLISAGPTREQIDPVRFFTNRSSGKMGFALAEAAANMGAEVTLVAGPVAMKSNHPLIHQIAETTAEDTDVSMTEALTNSV